ncbi:hypothetical protein [Geomicrobium sp. JCM 19055]|uniref:hypothetical protein n=1 Tax=Geomicrobium sp. JCM 19055 TaxID=1460649 RepID=UPI00045EDE59|nr:hypothetical protein [Geomicrobium sp. JCM 19055]GAK00863.1 hypothetical protein JCM19055_3981 [Geomicrobium sp. JCM 19055]
MNLKTKSNVMTNNLTADLIIYDADDARQHYKNLCTMIEQLLQKGTVSLGDYDTNFKESLHYGLRTLQAELEHAELIDEALGDDELFKQDSHAFQNDFQKYLSQSKNSSDACPRLRLKKGLSSTILNNLHSIKEGRFANGEPFNEMQKDHLKQTTKRLYKELKVVEEVEKEEDF